VYEVAARRGEVVTRSAASESGTTTAEMTKAADVGPAKPADVAAAKAADASAAAEAANVTTAEAPDVSATESAPYMSATTEATAVSTTVPTASAAAGKRVSGQSPRERGSRCQDDHRFT
jgi:hypothetical protein